jgi:hypothetical protein
MGAKTTTTQLVQCHLVAWGLKTHGFMGDGAAFARPSACMRDKLCASKGKRRRQSVCEFAACLPDSQCLRSLKRCGAVLSDTRRRGTLFLFDAQANRRWGRHERHTPSFIDRPRGGRTHDHRAWAVVRAVSGRLPARERLLKPMYSWASFTVA